MISKWLVYDSQVTLSGDGASTTTIRNLTSRNPADTLMLRPNGAGVSNFSVQNVTWAPRRDYFDLSGYRIDQVAIDLSQTVNSTVQDSYFKNIRTAAIYTYGNAASPVINLRIRRNHIYDASGDGITTFGVASGMIIDGNIIEYTPKATRSRFRTEPRAPAWPAGQHHDHEQRGPELERSVSDRLHPGGYPRVRGGSHSRLEQPDDEHVHVRHRGAGGGDAPRNLHHPHE